MNRNESLRINVHDPLWSAYRNLVRDVIIPYQWEVMNDRVDGVAKSHAISNLRIASGHEDGEFHGFRFQDSGVAKWLESVPHAIPARKDTEHAVSTRQGWFPSACYPPNLARLIASIGDYIYTFSENSIAIHLFIASEAEFQMAGTRIRISMKGNYPDSGDLRLAVPPSRKTSFPLRIRIPGWCTTGFH